MHSARNFASRLSPCALAVLSLLTTAVHAQNVAVGSGESASWNSGTMTGDVTFTGNDSKFSIGQGATVNGNVVVNPGVTGTTLLFTGDAYHSGAIGSADQRLGNVVFNSLLTGRQVSLRTDVWANTTTLGNLSANSTAVTLAPLTGSGLNFGGNLVMQNPNTSLDINTTRNTVEGYFKSSGGTLLFQLAPNTTPAAATSYASANYDVKNGAGSGQMTTQTLVVTGGETIGLNLTGSLKNGATYNLVNSAAAVNGGYGQNESSGRVIDNSFVIDSSVAVSADGRHLTYTASRSDDQYIVKSQTAGHFSNPAALTLGRIAAQGKQLGDLADVVERMDLDRYGYGDSAEKLAVQVKHLAPVANNSLLLAAWSAADLSLSQLDDRQSRRRGDIPGQNVQGQGSVWAQAFGSQGKQTGFNDYDGYRQITSGVIVGIDNPVRQGWVGASLSVGKTRVDQLDFRAGDYHDIDHALLSVYGTHEDGAWTVEGAATLGQMGVNGTRQTAQDRTARANWHLRYLDGRFGLGYRIKLADGKSLITPVVGMQASTLQQPTYTETGAGDLGLEMDGKTVSRLRFKTGVKFSTEDRFWHTPTFLSLSALVNSDQDLTNLDVASRYTGSTDASMTHFVTPAAKVARTSLQFGGAVSFAVDKDASLQVRYDIEHRQAYSGQSVALKFLKKF